jgi:vacuolar iron transporter family protein
MELDDYLKKHYIHRSNWLRAAVLGANDGIISMSSIAIGIATASVTKEPIILGSFAGLVAGALSMAAGEYVSVSTQEDTEKADIERERQELIETPDEELALLARIYEQRGLKKETALIVAQELTAADALGAHVRDELGITNTSQANAIQAAMASGGSFIAGGILPMMAVVILPIKSIEIGIYITTIIFLVILGAASAKAGGSSVVKAATRVVLWGTLAMGITAIAGYLFKITNL